MLLLQQGGPREKRAPERVEGRRDSRGQASSGDARPGKRHQCISTAGEHAGPRRPVVFVSSPVGGDLVSSYDSYTNECHEADESEKARGKAEEEVAVTAGISTEEPAPT